MGAVQNLVDQIGGASDHRADSLVRSRMINVDCSQNYERIVSMIKPTKFRFMYPCLVIAAIIGATSAFGAESGAVSGSPSPLCVSKIEPKVNLR